MTEDEGKRGEGESLPEPRETEPREEWRRFPAKPVGFLLPLFGSFSLVGSTAAENNNAANYHPDFISTSTVKLLTHCGIQSNMIASRMSR